MRHTVVAALLLAALLSIPSPARACWDGYLVDVDGVTFTGGDEVWSPATARELGSWTLRFRALLGPTGTLTSEFGAATACIGDWCEELDVPSASPRALFDAVAAKMSIAPSQVTAARNLEARPFAVQVAASRDRARADSLAERISALDLPIGFYEAGGFPADNPEAHVVEGIDDRGAVVYRVVVGAFLDRAAALGQQGEIARATQRPAFLRAL